MNRLKGFLQQRYTKTFGSNVYEAMKGYFGSHNVDLKLNDKEFADVLEKVFNQDEQKLKGFSFRIFDTNGDDKISENDLSDLMQLSSHVDGGYFKNPDFNKGTDIIELNERKFDMFLDVFGDDYNKIVKAIEKKKMVKEDV